MSFVVVFLSALAVASASNFHELGYAAPIVHEIAHAAPVVTGVAYSGPTLHKLPAPAHYDFGYDVSDPQTGDLKEHHESRRGDTVQGTYSLVESDGTRRIVDYHADAASGFKAVVRNEPLVHHVVAPIAREVVAPIAPLYHHEIVAPVAVAKSEVHVAQEVVHPARHEVYAVPALPQVRAAPILLHSAHFAGETLPYPLARSVHPYNHLGYY